MTPRPRARQIPITHVRVAADPERWADIYGTPPEDLVEAIHRYVVTLINDSPARQQGAIVFARRAKT